MKKSALPQLVLCAKKFNPKLGSYEREVLNAGNPMRLYDSLKLLLRQSTFDNILRLQGEADMFRTENMALLDRIEALQAEVAVLRSTLEIFNEQTKVEI